MIDLDIAAKRMALNVIERGPTSLAWMKEKAAECEKRHEAARKGGPHPCPSYVHCLLGVSQDVFGQDISPWPVCPRTVVRLVADLAEKARKLA